MFTLGSEKGLAAGGAEQDGNTYMYDYDFLLKDGDG